MPRPTLQLWRFDESEYDRTSQPYVCGKGADGRACRIGPDSAGTCLATYECLPRKDGSHHRCTRPESAGGKCAEGPSKEGVCAHAIEKCAPVRSWKSKRRVLSLGLALAALVTGCGTFFWRGPVSNVIVSPGPLRSAHAAIETDCADCHGASTRGWLAAATNPKPDGAKCLACHQQDAHALSPHGRAPSDRVERDAESKGLDCATCHPEHRGDRVGLVRGGDAGCRSCHADADGSLATAHPPFTSLASGTSRLNFDHTSKGHQAESCESCHALDGEGRRRVLPGFDEACSRCHLDDVAKPDALAWKGPSSITRRDDPLWERDSRAVACRVPLLVPQSKGEMDPATQPPPLPATALLERPWLLDGKVRVFPATYAPGLPASGEWRLEGDPGESGDLSYRPLVHADPVMRAWLDLVARHSGRKPRYKDDEGRCTMCHLLAPGEASREIAWTGHRDESRITRFSHRMHGEVACAGCHIASEKTFAGVTKDACTSCHAQGKASDGCLLCHGYHEDAPRVPAPVAETIAGPEACAGCHPNAAKALAASSHASSRLDTEERKASAAEIATKIGVKDPATDARCTTCHATVSSTSAITGVSCESCHGAGRAWIGVHADLSRADRGERARALGMIRVDDAFALADACLACHVIANPALVAAGHLSGSPMDAVLWSQGEVRHGFGDGCTGAETAINREMPPSRRRTLFVTGSLLDVSRSLDALAKSGAGDYADAMKARVTKAAKKLRKANEPALSGELDAVLDSIDALALSGEGDALPSRDAMSAASAKAREAAMRVSASRSPASVDAIDDAIGAKIKGAPWTPM